jgi:hypothetical protein
MCVTCVDGVGFLEEGGSERVFVVCGEGVGHLVCGCVGRGGVPSAD